MARRRNSSRRALLRNGSLRRLHRQDHLLVQPGNGFFSAAGRWRMVRNFRDDAGLSFLHRGDLIAIPIRDPGVGAGAFGGDV